MQNTKTEIRLPKDPKHRLFADLVLAAYPPAEAYRLAGFSAKSPQSRATNSCRLLKNADIAAYIEERQQRLAEQSELDQVTTEKNLVEIWQSKPSEASMDNPLCEVKWTKDGPVPVFPSKIKVMERLARMRGWDAPVKNEVSASEELAKAIATMKNSD